MCPAGLDAVVRGLGRAFLFLSVCSVCLDKLDRAPLASTTISDLVSSEQQAQLSSNAILAIASRAPRSSHPLAAHTQGPHQ